MAAGQSATPPATDGELWDRALRAAADNRRLVSIIEDLRLEGVKEGTALLVGQRPLVAMAQMNAAAIEDLLSRVGGRPIRIDIRAEETTPAETTAAPLVNLNDHPLVKQAVELFGVKSPIRVMPRKMK